MWRTSGKRTDIGVSASDTPNVKMPTMRRLTGTNTSDACIGEWTANMIVKRTTSERPRFARPETTMERVKIDGGTRTRFISGPFQPTLSIAFTVVCEKKFHATYAERK